MRIGPAALFCVDGDFRSLRFSVRCGSPAELWHARAPNLYFSGRCPPSGPQCTLVPSLARGCRIARRIRVCMMSSSLSLLEAVFE